MKESRESSARGVSEKRKHVEPTALPMRWHGALIHALLWVCALLCVADSGVRVLYVYRASTSGAHWYMRFPLALVLDIGVIAWCLTASVLFILTRNQLVARKRRGIVWFGRLCLAYPLTFPLHWTLNWVLSGNVSAAFVITGAVMTMAALMIALPVYLINRKYYEKRAQMFS